MMKKTSNKKPYTLKTLASGLRIMTVPMKNPTATVLVLVEAGSKYETKKQNGISHFLEHMCFKGTTNRPALGQVLNELDNLGAQYNAFTGQEYTGYYAKGRATQVEALVDIVSDIYLNPSLPKEEIEKEKGVICDEINMYEDTPARKVYNILQELLYGDTPAGRAISGTKEDVNSFKRNDIVIYRNKNYVLEKTLVVVAGDINETKIQKVVAEKFKSGSKQKGQKKQKVVEKQSKPNIKVQYKKTDQTHILIGFRSFEAKHKDTKIVNTISGVLGAGMSSRLFTKIRNQMGVGYYVGSYNDTSTDTGALVLRAGVTPDRADEVLSAMLTECKKICDKEVTKDELNKIGEIVSGGLFMGLESSDAVAEFYGEQAILRENIKTADEIEKNYRNVSPKDVLRVANDVFKPENLNVAIIGPHKDSKKFNKIVKSF